ncbi:MAG: transcription antitermination protein NusB [Ardenticatenales bacterium]
MALECLYELDQSTHVLDAVVVHRAEAMVEEALLTLGDRVPLALRNALVAPAAHAFLLASESDAEETDAAPADRAGRDGGADVGQPDAASPDAASPHAVSPDAASPVSPWPAALSADAAADLVARTRATPSAVAEAFAKVSALRTQVGYGGKIVYGVVASRAAIDRVIAEIAPEWPVPQMAPVDRNVLRIALWEIGSGSAPLRVVINEAVEMAREYVGESTRRMVNGALGTYATRTNPLDLAAKS